MLVLVVISQEAGAGAVKLEGGSAACCAAVAKLVECGIPVVGHVGLAPQHAAATGGFRAQGRTAEAALRVVRDAQALEAAGCFAVVVECVPPDVAAAVTAALRVPTIGIGAGPGTAGQVLVFHDMLGLRDHASLQAHSGSSSSVYAASPRFCKKFADAGAAVHAGLAAFCAEVASGAFPGPEHTPYRMASGHSEQLEAMLLAQGFAATAPAATAPAMPAAAAAMAAVASVEPPSSLPLPVLSVGSHAEEPFLRVPAAKETLRGSHEVKELAAIQKAWNQDGPY